MPTIFQPPRAFIPNASGVKYAGAKAYFYITGTTTPKDTYTDFALTTPSANPVVADSNGDWATIYLKNDVRYRVTLKDSGGATIYTQDDVGGPVITLAELGQIIYPTTNAESAASVTPATYSENTYLVTRFGATGDGVTVDTTAIQNALNAARYGLSRVHFPSRNSNGQTIYITGKLAVYEGTQVTADAGVIVRSAVTNANDHVFECISTLGAGTALTSNGNKRDATVAVTSVSGLAAGMIVAIRDATYKFGSTGRNVELNEIDSIASLNVTLKNRLIGNYATASSAELVPVTTPARNIKFENIYVDIPSSKDGGAFYFQEAYNCDVTNCRSTGQKGQPGIHTWRSAHIRITGGDFSDGQSQGTPGYGYGCNFGEASHHCVAKGVTFRNVRECAVAANARYCGYVACISVSSYDNAFNSHALGAEDCYFDGCKSYSARSKGFYAGGVTGQAPDKRIRFSNCESYYSGYHGFWCEGDTGVEPEDVTYDNCRAFHYGDDTATSYGFYITKSTRPRVLGCYVNPDGETNARAGVKVEVCSDAIVRGNTVCGSSSGWGVIHENCTGVVIDDNSISGIGGSTQGVYTEGTASTKVYVRRNRVDNDMAFTKNSGDIYELNEYNTKRQTARGANASTTDGATITHGLVGTPISVRCQGTVSGEFISVTAVGGTTFTVAIKKHDNTAGTSQTVYWEADA